METEKWLPVVGYEGFYEVSDLGRVRSLRRKTRSGMRGGMILKPSCNVHTHWYLMVGLSRNSVVVSRPVHKLVMEAFAGSCPPGQEVLHGPGGKHDNRFTEMRYGTRKENMHDKVRDGSNNNGERHGMAKMTDEAVLSIRQRVAAGESQRVVAAEYGVTFQNISMIVIGKTWTHVGGPLRVASTAGSANGNARLTWADADEIRRRLGAGDRRRLIAEDFGVCLGTVDKIRQGILWKRPAA